MRRGASQGGLEGGLEKGLEGGLEKGLQGGLEILNSRRGLQGVSQAFEGGLKGGLRRGFKGVKSSAADSEHTPHPFSHT